MSDLQNNKPTKILDAIFKIQSEMPTIQKSGKNTFFKSPANPDGSPYPLLEDILDACRPLEKKHGVLVMHQVNEIVEGRKLLSTIFCHIDSETKHEVSIPLMLQKQDMQGLASAITYAKRQNISCVYNIQTEVDDDGNGTIIQKQKPQENKPQPQAPQKTHGRFTFAGGKFSGKHMRDIPQDQLNNYLAWMEEQNKPNLKTTIEAIYAFLRGEKE